jgi:GT2 family glycosyltransferase
MLKAETSIKLPASTPRSEPGTSCVRIEARGKFLFDGDEKIYVKGVTYGAFRPDDQGREYQDHRRIEADFAQMAANGFNAVRIPHTSPPRSLLDAALRHGLRVMVGLSAEQFIGYLIDRKNPPDIEQAIRSKVQAIRGHPALLCYAIGNEIPAPVARWLGRRRVERYLHRIYRVVKQADPRGLVTYVNYPTTEYLDLPFLDLVSFNVYLESEEPLRAYLARLQNIAGDKPLIMTEVGLDALRNSETRQAQVLDWEVRAAFASGCAGVFVFSWTDEWYRAGAEVDDWEFGITRRDRKPKPALSVLRTALAEMPFSADLHWPLISVVVCSFNGSHTIGECLEAIGKIRYSAFEVIVVDDGSTDDTAAIAAQYNSTLIHTPNHGLSHARNVGWQAAKGEIIAYIDDDAYPDPDWLTYIAATFRDGNYAGVGGPNILPPHDGPIAACVDNSPGGPQHVLLTDTEAEHIPGCNMAFLRTALCAVGGFDERFRVAGDDVDICWRLQERGWKLGFSPSAQVWHHRRNSVRAYLRQQKGYGKAEALLEEKWPQKYNSLGHLSWLGRVYGAGVPRVLGTVTRVYFGQWGSAPFQRLYERSGRIQSLFLMPEWYLANLVLVAIGALGITWRPLSFFLPLLAISAGIPIGNACASAARSRFVGEGLHLPLRVLTALLHTLQPAARLYGRLRHGLHIWRSRVPAGFAIPVPHAMAIWTERWEAPRARLESIEGYLRCKGVPVERGGQWDPWDLQIQAGFWGGARLLMAVEDHGAGTQYVRCRVRPKCFAPGLVLSLTLALFSVGAGIDGAATTSILLALGALLFVCRTVLECGRASAVMLHSIGAHYIATAEQQPMQVHG